MSVKQNLYTHCLEYVQQRIGRIKDAIDGAQRSANEETKSSAGDKYETSRAMAQLEIERNLRQLNEAEKLQQILQTIVTTRDTEVAVPGSLINTSKGVFYIAISLGLVTLDQKQYFVVSADSPIGKLLMGKRVGESINWSNQPYRILGIE